MTYLVYVCSGYLVGDRWTGDLLECFFFLPGNVHHLSLSVFLAWDHPFFGWDRHQKQGRRGGAIKSTKEGLTHRLGIVDFGRESSTPFHLIQVKHTLRYALLSPPFFLELPQRTKQKDARILTLVMIWHYVKNFRRVPETSVGHNFPVNAGEPCCWVKTSLMRQQNFLIPHPSFWSRI